MVAPNTLPYDMDCIHGGLYLRCKYTTFTIDTMSDDNEFLSEESYEFEFEDEDEEDDVQQVSHQEHSAVC